MQSTKNSGNRLVNRRQKPRTLLSLTLGGIVAVTSFVGCNSTGSSSPAATTVASNSLVAFKNTLSYAATNQLATNKNALSTTLKPTTGGQLSFTFESDTYLTSISFQYYDIGARYAATLDQNPCMSDFLVTNTIFFTQDTKFAAGTYTTTPATDLTICKLYDNNNTKRSGCEGLFADIESANVKIMAVSFDYAILAGGQGRYGKCMEGSESSDYIEAIADWKNASACLAESGCSFAQNYTITLPSTWKPTIVVTERLTAGGNLEEQARLRKEKLTGQVNSFTGYTGADYLCASDAALRNSTLAPTSNWKALLWSNKSTESGLTYYKKDALTEVASATGGELVGDNPIINWIYDEDNQFDGIKVWTGGSIVPNSAIHYTCSDWTDNTDSQSGYGDFGGSGIGGTTTSQWYNISASSCQQPLKLLCVQQRGAYIPSGTQSLPSFEVVKYGSKDYDDLIINNQQKFTLTSNQAIRTPTDQKEQLPIELAMQSDGNLVIYYCADTNCTTGHASWASGTAGETGSYLSFQADGNLVIYNSSNESIWSSATETEGAYLKLIRKNGSLNIYGASGSLVWTSGNDDHTDERI